MTEAMLKMDDEQTEEMMKRMRLTIREKLEIDSEPVIEGSKGGERTISKKRRQGKRRSRRRWKVRQSGSNGRRRRWRRRDEKSAKWKRRREKKWKRGREEGVGRKRSWKETERRRSRGWRRYNDDCAKLGAGRRKWEWDSGRKRWTMAAPESDDEEAATKKGEVVEKADTMAAARGNDGEVAAAASAIAIEATRVQRRGGGRRRAENDEASRCEVAHHKLQSSCWTDARWSQRMTGESRSWCRAGKANEQKREDWMSWYSMSASEGGGQVEDAQLCGRGSRSLKNK